MKYSIIILLLALTTACSDGDKQREDFPNTHQKGEQESDRRISEEAKSSGDTMNLTDSAHIHPH